jgi:hypothetical protein
MPVLEIDGVGDVEVGDEFLKLAPEQQQSYVNQLHTQLNTPAPKYKDKGALYTAARGLTDILTVGFGDELKAGVNSALGRGNYDDLLKSIREDDKQHAEQHPVANFAGQVGGGIAQLPLGGAKLVASGAGALGKTLLGAGLGAAQGAAYGFGSGEEGVANRLSSGAVGAGVGAATGAVVAPAASAIGNLVRGKPSLPGYNAQAVQKVMSGIERDGAESVAKRVSELGDNAMLLDGGYNVRGQAEALASMPGKSQSVIKDAIFNRAKGSGDRVTGMTDELVGKRQNFFETMQKQVGERRGRANILYTKAFSEASPVDTSKTISLIEGRLQPGVANKITNTNAMDDSISSALIKAKSLLEGNGAQRFGIETLHQAQDEIDDMVSAAFRNGRGKQGAALKEVRDSLLSEIDAASPTYKMARKTYAGDRAVERAMEDGQSVFSRSVRPDELTSTLGKFSKEEKQAFLIGARDQIDEIVGTARNDAGAAIRELAEKGWNKEKLSVLVGKEKADKLINKLQNEKIFADTANTISGNSRTASRQAAMKEFPNVADGDTVGRELRGSSLFGFIADMGRRGVNSVSGNMSANKNAKIGLDAAGLLTKPANSPEVQGILELVSRAPKNKQRGLLAEILMNSQQSPLTAQGIEQIRGY